MLPICYVLLAEAIPARHRGWLMILIGADIAGAYILTSWLAAELVPVYSWRILWLIGMPTGVLFYPSQHLDSGTALASPRERAENRADDP